MGRPAARHPATPERRQPRPPSAVRVATQPRPGIPGRWKSASTLPRGSRPALARRTWPCPRRHREAGPGRRARARCAPAHSPAGWPPGRRLARTTRQLRSRTRARRRRAAAPCPRGGRWCPSAAPAQAVASGGIAPGQRAALPATAGSSPPRRAGCRQCRSPPRSAGRPRASPRRPARAVSHRWPARARGTSPPPCGAARPRVRAGPAAGPGAGRRTGDGSATSRALHPAASGTARPAPPAPAGPGCLTGR